MAFLFFYIIKSFYICSLDKAHDLKMNFKDYFIQLCNWLDKSYWGLKPRKRRIVGWCILITCITTLYFGGYLFYRGGKAIGQLCQSAWFSITEGDEQEEEYANSDEWSFKGNHREFPVLEKNSKRYVQLGKDFDDLNDVQLAAAKKLGIKPLNSREDITKVLSKLVELKETKYYTIDPLTHSVPYLVPDAADFLTALGKLMQEYNGTHSRFILTSVLRTGSDVKSLSRTNGNASQNSCHCYGTTIDITYNRFDRRGITNDVQLKADLARALYDLKKAGYCYVKYEKKQACFHITVRPK